METITVKKSTRPLKPLRAMSDERFRMLLLDTLEDIYRNQMEPTARATAECGGPVGDPYRRWARKVQRVLFTSRVLLRPRWC